MLRRKTPIQVKYPARMDGGGVTSPARNSFEITGGEPEGRLNPFGTIAVGCRRGMRWTMELSPGRDRGGNP